MTKATKFFRCVVNECGVLDDRMSEGSEVLNINVARKSRQVGESQLDTFPQQRDR